MAEPLTHPSAWRAPHAFDLATGVVAAGDGAWTATVDPGWTVGGRPNGGYLLALATRAALAPPGPAGAGEAVHPDPLAVSGHFWPRRRRDRPSWW